MLDHFGRGKRAQPPGILMAGAAHQPEQESGGKEIAGARGIDHLVDRKRRHRNEAVGRCHHAAFLAAGDDAESNVAAQLLQRGVKIRGLVQRMQLGLIGEHQIDRAARASLEKLAAIAVDAKQIR